MVAVLAAGAAVLATNQASSGVQTTTRAHRAGNAAASSFPASSGTTVRATVATDGTQAARGAADGLISGDGRWEVFSSLDALDATSTAARAGQSAIFVRDLRSRRTRQISQGTDDASTDGTPVTEAGAVPNGQSFSPSISSDGRYVSFLTAATNIVPFSVTKATTLVVCDRDPTGATDAR